jgi:hypothetical protein
VLSLRFHPLSAPVSTHWELYSSLIRIPLTLTVGEPPAIPNRLYCRNYDERHSLLEFYFDRPTQVLQEFVIVVLTGTLNQTVPQPLVYDPQAYYRCQLAELDSPLTTVPLCLYVAADQVILYYPEANQALTYYQVGHNFLLGVTSHGHLAAIALTGLTHEALEAILGDVQDVR